MSTLQTYPIMYMLIGLPASGKTTWMNSNLTTDVVIISSDLYIDQYAESVGKTYSQVYHECINRANSTSIALFFKSLREGKSIVIDRTNLSKKVRQSYLKKIPTGYKKIAVVFEIPEALRESRHINRAKITGKDVPEEVINSMRKAYTFPSVDEGFDDILTIRK